MATNGCNLMYSSERNNHGDGRQMGKTAPVS
jgi:hypothetical protein